MSSHRYDMPQIDRARMVKGWTWHELARRAGVSAGTAQSLAHGKSVRPSTVKALAKALGLKREDLVIPASSSTEISQSVPRAEVSAA